MKFILFRTSDKVKKCIQVNKIMLNNEEHIDEIMLNKDQLEKRLTNTKRILCRIKAKFYDRALKKCIMKTLNEDNTKWYYILDKSIQVNSDINKFLDAFNEQLLGFRLSVGTEMNKNIFNYISDYLNKKKIKENQIRCLIVCSRNKNLDFNLITSMLNNLKTVDIYLDEAISKYTQNQISKINASLGSVVQFVKKSKKAFSEYNVIYFIDTMKQAFPRLRFNKEALVIDLNDSYNDRYNSNIVAVNNYISDKLVVITDLDNMYKNYGKLELAFVINKMVRST